MISKREWYAALRRMLKRAALVFGGLYLMAAFFYWRVFDLRLEAALLATLSAVLTGYGMAGWAGSVISSPGSGRRGKRWRTPQRDRETTGARRMTNVCEAMRGMPTRRDLPGAHL